MPPAKLTISKSTVSAPDVTPVAVTRMCACQAGGVVPVTDVMELLCVFESDFTTTKFPPAAACIVASVPVYSAKKKVKTLDSLTDSRQRALCIAAAVAATICTRDEIKLTTSSYTQPPTSAGAGL